MLNLILKLKLLEIVQRLPQFFINPVSRRTLVESVVCLSVNGSGILD